MSALTGWFDGKVRPVRPGVYQRSTRHGGAVYAMWDGKLWRRFSGGIDSAAKQKQRSLFQDLAWRGFTSDQSTP